MKRLLPFVAVAVCFGLGMLVDRGLWSRSSAATAARSGGDADASGAAAEATAAVEGGNGGSAGLGKASPKVAALLAGFDRRKPVASRVAVLEKIMAASAADVAEMAKAMSRSDGKEAGWRETNTALLRRWLEVAPDEAIAWAKTVQRGGEDPEYLPHVLAELARFDPTRAVAEAQRLTNPAQSNKALYAVARTIAQTDPEHAYRLAPMLSPHQHYNIFHNLLGAWVERNSANVASSLRMLKNVFKDKQEQADAAEALVGRWASQDPPAALAGVKALPESGPRYHAFLAYFSVMGGRDPKGAMDQILELPNDPQKIFVETVLWRWMGTDFDGATAWVLARPDPLEQQRLLKVALRNRGFNGNFITDEQAAQLVAKLDPGPGREEASEAASGGWKPSPDALLRHSKSLPAAEAISLRETTVQRLVSRDPGQPGVQVKSDLIKNPASDLWGDLGVHLAKSVSPTEAFEWANTLPDERSRQKAVPAVLAHKAEENPAEAAKEALLVADEATRLAAVSSVAGRWATAGMDEALTWAKGLGGNEREAALRGVLEEGARQDPAVAAKEFEALMAGVAPETKPADALLSAAGSIATAYFAANEHAAAEWAATLPHDEARAAAVKSLAEQWSEYDPAGAGKWIGTLPDGAPRDAAVGQLVGKLVTFDPATAFAWAGTVADPGQRSSLLQTTLDSWRKVDAAAARTAIQATDWPEREKTKWLNRLR